MQPLKVIISGGGTGGHIYPAIAIANALKAKLPTSEILFVGAEGKMEMEKVPKAGYRIEGLPIAGMKRSFSLENLTLPFKLAKSLSKAKSIIQEFKPNVVVGVGGFASGPTLMMAGFSGIPTLIQEQNSYAGVTNKLLAKRAARICVAYPNMEQFFPADKIKFTGNPVRTDIATLTGKEAQAYGHFGLSNTKKTLFVMGGSLGAKSINEAIVSNLQLITNAGYQLIWQTGKLFIDTAQKQVAALNISHLVKPFEFIYEMDLAYTIANAVISRAGALSVSELCLAGKPSILVPFPFASEDHQTSNAMALVDRQAALLIRDSEAASKLIPQALSLLADDVLQHTLAKNARSLAIENAADVIANEVIMLAK